MKKSNNIVAMVEKAREYPIEQLLTSYGCQVQMRRTRCPIHEGDNPQSFEIKNNRGKCHSCGWSGDSIEFVRKMEGCTFIEAVRRLQ